LPTSTKEKSITYIGKDATMFIQNGKLYVRKIDKAPEDYRNANTTLVYEEVNKKAYEARLKKIADKLVELKTVKLEDVITDALKDYTLETLDKIEKELNTEFTKAEEEKREPNIKTKPKHCVEVVIGRKLCFALR